PRSLRPLRCAVAALAGALLLLPATAAGATTSPGAPAAATVEGALATVQTQLDALRGQIEVAAAQEARLEGVLTSWSRKYDVAQARVERLLMRKQFLRTAMTTASAHPTAVPAFVAVDQQLRGALDRAQTRKSSLTTSMPPLSDVFRAQRTMRKLQRAR